MGRRGNPYDNAKAESFMKTMKVEAVYPMAYETFNDVVENLPWFIDGVYDKRRLHSASRLSQPAAVRGPAHPADGQISGLNPVRLEGPLQAGAIFASIDSNKDESSTPPIRSSLFCRDGEESRHPPFGFA
jgi:hypothetical protein